MLCNNSIPHLPTILSRLLRRNILSPAAYSAGAPPPLTLANWSSQVRTTTSGAAADIDSSEATAAPLMAQSPCMDARWTEADTSSRAEDGDEDDGDGT